MCPLRKQFVRHIIFRGFTKTHTCDLRFAHASVLHKKYAVITLCEQTRQNDPIGIVVFKQQRVCVWLFTTYLLLFRKYHIVIITITFVTHQTTFHLMLVLWSVTGLVDCVTFQVRWYRERFTSGPFPHSVAFYREVDVNFHANSSYSVPYIDIRLYVDDTRYDPKVYMSF